MSTHGATISWQRNGAAFTDKKYSRAHTWKFDGGAVVPASSSPHVVRPPLSNPAGVDPEEAFVASLSSCHLLWFLSIACRQGFVVESYQDNPTGLMAANGDGKLAITLVTLRPNVAFAGDKIPDEATFQAMHHEAHEECFIANSVKAKVACEPRLMAAEIAPAKAALTNLETPVVVEAQLDRLDHQQAVVSLTAAYAEDTMGNGGPLPAEVLEQLVPGLRSHPTTLIMLAYVGEMPVGIATCFVGFSTFAARPLVNIHDLAVLPAYGGHGIGRELLRGVERAARLRGCVKVTLEVQEHNHRARQVYDAAGFAQAVYGPTTGGSLFYSKTLSDDPESAAQS